MSTIHERMRILERDITDALEAIPMSGWIAIARLDDDEEEESAVMAAISSQDAERIATLRDLAKRGVQWNETDASRVLANIRHGLRSHLMLAAQLVGPIAAAAVLDDLRSFMIERLAEELQSQHERNALSALRQDEVFNA